MATSSKISDRDLRARAVQLRPESETVTLIGSSAAKELRAHHLYVTMLGLSGTLFDRMIRESIILTGKAAFYEQLPSQDRILSTEGVPIPQTTVVDLRGGEPTQSLRGVRGCPPAPGDGEDGGLSPSDPAHGTGGGAEGGATPTPKGADQ